MYDLYEWSRRWRARRTWTTRGETRRRRRGSRGATGRAGTLETTSSSTPSLALCSFPTCYRGRESNGLCRFCIPSSDRMSRRIIWVETLETMYWTTQPSRARLGKLHFLWRILPELGCYNTNCVKRTITFPFFHGSYRCQTVKVIKRSVFPRFSRS